MADGRVKVVHHGQVGSVPDDEVEAVVAQGGRVLNTRQDIIDAKNQEFADSPLGTAANLPIQALDAATLGGSTALAVGLAGEGARARLKTLRDKNPVTTIVGQGLGIGASALATGGTGLAGTGARAVTAPARLALQGGKAVETAARTALAGRVPASVARVAAKGAGLAAEGAAFGVGGALSESALDPEFTADAALSHVGLGALLGGSLGVAGTVGSEVLGRAVPAAVQGVSKAVQEAVEKAAKAAGKPLKKVRRRKGVTLPGQMKLDFDRTSPPGASRAGIDAVEIREMNAAQKVHKAAQTKAATITKPHARAVAQAVDDAQLELFKTSSKTKGAIPTPRARNIPKTNAALAATEAAGLSRAVRTGAMEAGDTAAQRAAGAYDRTIAALPETDIGGRFTAAARLRNSLPKTQAGRHLVEQVDQHLSNKSLYGKTANEWVEAKNATEALFRSDDAFATEILGNNGRASRDKVSQILGGVSEGSPRQLDTLRGLSTRLDQYLAIVRRGRPNAPNVTIPPELRTENLRAVTMRLTKAVNQAEKAVKPANVERDAAKSVLDLKAGAAAALAKKLLPNNPLGRAALEALGQGAIGGAPGALLGAAFGVDPFVGASLGNLAHMAKNPKKFVGMLNRLHNAAGAVKVQHSQQLKAWLGGKEQGKPLRRTAHFAPGLRTMLESKSPEKKREGFREYRQALQDAQSNPEQTSSQLTDALSPVQAVAPGIAERIAGASLNRLMWLLDHMPVPPGGADMQQLLDDMDSVSDTELNRFARVAAVVEDPTSILPHITEGTVTREEVVALRETAPGYHQFLLQTISEHIATNKVPYSRRLTLGTVFEAPLTSGLSNIQVFQQLLASRQEQQAQPQQLVTRSPTPSSQASQSPLDAAVSR